MRAEGPAALFCSGATRSKQAARLESPLFFRSSTILVMPDQMSSAWKPGSAHISSTVVFSLNTSPYTLTGSENVARCL
jgi:hypothetical protein